MQLQKRLKVLIKEINLKITGKRSANNECVDVSLRIPGTV